MPKILQKSRRVFSPCTPKKRMLEKSSNFFKRVRNEALKKKTIKVGTKYIDFGTEGPIILESGKLWLITAEIRGGKWGKHYILVGPNLKSILSKKETFLRIDSGCLSGMVFGDTTCDCLQQLREAQKIIAKFGGIIIHIPDQDGRGWQEYKMANQRIMRDCSIDTISAAIKFYGDMEIIDSRTYEEAATILKALGFSKRYKFILGTENTSKIYALKQAGFNVKTKPIKTKGLGKKARLNLNAKYRYWKLKRNKK